MLLLFIVEDRKILQSSGVFGRPLLILCYSSWETYT